MKTVAAATVELFHNDYTYYSGASTFVPENAYVANTWFHLYLQFYSVTSGYSYVKFCSNLICATPDYRYSLNTATQNNNVYLVPDLVGYLKEIRVWNVDSGKYLKIILLTCILGNDYLHFYKR